MHALADLIDRCNRAIGHTVAWLTLFMVLVQFVVVLLRYIFGLGFIWMQESIIYMHAIMFMTGAAYTLLRDGHVRVDVFYRGASERFKAWSNLLGTIFLLIPVCSLILWASWGYAVDSWMVWEGSKETSGIQAVYILKTVILVFAALMILQGISVVLRALVTLRTDDYGAE
ncbi:TRAP transporter small permease subunit [Magnetospira thiophila]